MNTVETLKAMRALIEKPEHWCKDEYRNGDAYCLRGAWEATGGTSRAYSELATCVSQRYPDQGPVSFNDAPETTHEDVLALIDETIERVKADAKT